MRGLPGSGKSYTANKIAEENNGVIYSTDNYFTKNGEYMFDPTKLRYAHQWNQINVEKAMNENYPFIIVDNTNTLKWEYKIYLDFAKKYDYNVRIQYPTSPWWKEIQPRIKDKTFTKEDVNVFFKKNEHGVPFDTIHNMMKRFEF